MAGKNPDPASANSCRKPVCSATGTRRKPSNVTLSTVSPGSTGNRGPRAPTRTGQPVAAGTGSGCGNVPGSPEIPDVAGVGSNRPSASYQLASGLIGYRHHHAAPLVAKEQPHFHGIVPSPASVPGLIGNRTNALRVSAPGFKIGESGLSARSRVGVEPLEGPENAMGP
jgi:hypothetical protein